MTIRFKYKVSYGYDASKIILDAKLPGWNENDSGMTNCATPRLFNQQNAMVVEVFHEDKRVFLFQTGYIDDFIQFIMVDHEYRGHGYAKRMVKYIVKKYMNNPPMVYVATWRFETNKKFLPAPDYVYDMMFSRN